MIDNPQNVLNKYGSVELIVIHLAISLKVSVKEAQSPLKPANVYKRKAFCLDVISFIEMLSYERKFLRPEFMHCFDALVVKFCHCNEFDRCFQGRSFHRCGLHRRNRKNSQNFVENRVIVHGKTLFSQQPSPSQP